MKTFFAPQSALDIIMGGGSSPTPPTPITLTKIGQVTSVGNVTSLATDTTAAVDSGGHIIVLAGLSSSGVPTFTDGSGVDLNKTTVMSDTEYVRRLILAYKYYPAGLASGTTITSNLNVGNILQIGIFAATGLAINPFDQQTVGNAGAANTAFTTVASGALSQANSLAIAFGNVASGGTDAVFTQPSGWSAFGRVTAGTGEISLDGGYQVTTTTSALTYATTLPVARNWIAGLTILKGV